MVQLKLHRPVHCFPISAAKSLLWKQLFCLVFGFLEGGLVLSFLFVFSLQEVYEEKK